MAKAKEKSKGQRQQISFRMKTDHIALLDALCKVNKRSRRDIVEILIADAYAVWSSDPTDRINPT